MQQQDINMPGMQAAMLLILARTGNLKHGKTFVSIHRVDKRQNHIFFFQDFYFGSPDVVWEIQNQGNQGIVHKDCWKTSGFRSFSFLVLQVIQFHCSSFSMKVM